MDNKLNYSFLRVILCLVLALFSYNANAGQNLKIVVVDIQKVIDDSIAVVELRKSIDTLSEQLYAEMLEKEASLKKLATDLEKKRGMLKEEDFNTEVNDFYKKVSDVQHEMQDKKAKLEQAHSAGVKQIHDTTVKIIAELAKEKGFNVALPIAYILYTDDNLSITKEVTLRLNQDVKSIKLDYK